MSPPLRSRLSHQPGRSRGMEQGRGCRGAAGPGSEKQRGAGERRIWSSTIPPPPCCPSATARCSQPTRPVTGRASAVTGAASPWKSARSGAGRGAAGHDQARRGPGGGSRCPQPPEPPPQHSPLCNGAGPSARISSPVPRSRRRRLPERIRRAGRAGQGHGGEGSGDGAQLTREPPVCSPNITQLRIHTESWNHLA